MLDETLSFYVNEESLMRRQLTGMKLEKLRKERDKWRNRAEEKQRLQEKKEEACWSPKGRKDFEREYKEKVKSRAPVLTSRLRQRRGEIFAGVGGQASRESSGRRPEEGS